MAWYICQYIWVTELDGTLWRYCAMNDYTEQLRVDAGRPPQDPDDWGGYPAGETPLWAECEFLGDRAIVKVHSGASPSMLATLDAAFFRIPAEVMDIALEDQNVSNRDLQAMWQVMQDAGYTLQDIYDALGIDRWQDLRRKTLRQFGHAITSRWRRPKGWNQSENRPEFEDVDWPGGAPTTIEAIDARIL